MKKAPTVGSIDKQLAKLHLKEVELSKQKNLLISQQTMVKCEECVDHGRWVKGCDSTFPIGELVYTQTYYYNDNTGSPNGGYYQESEGQWDCPKCKHRNRLIFKYEHISKFKHLFKKIVKQEPDYHHTNHLGY
jgi:rubrerythrin